MTADISGATIAPVQVAKGASAPVRSRAPAEGSSPGPGPVSFQSLLGALGFSSASLAGQDTASGKGSDEMPTLAPGIEPAIAPAIVPEAESVADTASVAAWSLLLVPNQAFAQLAPLSPDAGSAAGVPVGSALRAPVGGAPARGPLDGDSLPDDATHLSSEPADESVATPGRKAASWLLAHDGAEAGIADSKIVGSPRDFLARVEAARVASEADAGASRARAVGSGPMQPSIAVPVDAEGSGLRAYAAQRPAERFSQRSVAAAVAAAGGATPGPEGMSPGTSHGASPVYAPGAATPVPAAALAEKVHHWVARGVQNAQLQLDAFGGGSVDVSISVMGHDTIVDFRTDNAQARSMLLEAMPQLKQMLESEGLVFTGGFVGASGQRGAGSQRRDGSGQEGRDAAVRTGRVMPAGTAPADRSPGASGASIDLFV